MAQEEEVLGKAYDSRLMKRLLTYLRAYRWQTTTALASIFLKAGADVLGPYLTIVAIDKYLSPVSKMSTPLNRYLSDQPLVGIGQIAALYVSLLALQLSTGIPADLFHAVDRPDGDVRPARANLSPSSAPDIAFFDKNPVGRLVTRVTSDVDALNDMFTSGVVSHLRRRFRARRNHHHHAENRLEPGSGHICGVAIHSVCHQDFSQIGSAISTARSALPSPASTLTCKSTSAE